MSNGDSQIGLGKKGVTYVTDPDEYLKQFEVEAAVIDNKYKLEAESGILGTTNMAKAKAFLAAYNAVDQIRSNAVLNSIRRKGGFSKQGEAGGWEYKEAFPDYQEEENKTKTQKALNFLKRGIGYDQVRDIPEASSKEQFVKDYEKLRAERFIPGKKMIEEGTRFDDSLLSKMETDDWRTLDASTSTNIGEDGNWLSTGTLGSAVSSKERDFKKSLIVEDQDRNKELERIKSTSLTPGEKLTTKEDDTVGITQEDIDEIAAPPKEEGGFNFPIAKKVGKSIKGWFKGDEKEELVPDNEELEDLLLDDEYYDDPNKYGYVVDDQGNALRLDGGDYWDEDKQQWIKYEGSAEIKDYDSLSPEENKKIIKQLPTGYEGNIIGSKDDNSALDVVNNLDIKNQTEESAFKMVKSEHKRKPGVSYKLLDEDETYLSNLGVEYDDLSEEQFYDLPSIKGSYRVKKFLTGGNMEYIRDKFIEDSREFDVYPFRTVLHHIYKQIGYPGMEGSERAYVNTLADKIHKGEDKAIEKHFLKLIAEFRNSLGPEEEWDKFYLEDY